VRYKRLICEGEKPAARIAERAVMWKVHAEDAAFFYAFFSVAAVAACRKLRDKRYSGIAIIWW
jgi:hypothetical protein